jgi:hypothetical protein
VGLHCGFAYVFTDSLAFPVGIHLPTNLWMMVVFGQPDSGYPAAFRLARPFDLGAKFLLLLFHPAGILVAAVLLWVRATRGNLSEVSLRATR